MTFRRECWCLWQAEALSWAQRAETEANTSVCMHGTPYKEAIANTDLPNKAGSCG